MKQYKHLVNSQIFSRRAHADVFEVGDGGELSFVLFGGSGVDADEYEARASTLTPTLDSPLRELEGRGLNFTFIYVSAPYDVPIRHLPQHPDAARWNAHVTEELLPAWLRQPHYLCGFSGGALLVLSGLHEGEKCFGAAALAADQLPSTFSCPGHWSTRLRLYCAAGDVVCLAAKNRQTARALADRGQVEVISIGPGRHRLSDYRPAVIDIISSAYTHRASI